MLTTIYQITNKVNGKIYIGFTTLDPPELRWQQHKRFSEKYDYALYRAIRKYGLDHFEFSIIYQSLDNNHCHKIMETEFIRSRNSHTSKNGYNMTMGGDGTNGLILSESHKKNISKSLKGKIVSAETRIKMGNAKRGIKHSQETKDKLKTLNSRRMSQKNKDRLRDLWSGNKNPNFGKPLSEDTKRKISEAQKIRHKNKLSQISSQ